jgi:hypothetical protein
MSKVYRTKESSVTDAPDYIIRDGRFYRTVHHPAGWSDSPDFEIRDDGKVYSVRTGETASRTPVYEFREIMLYRTAAHPDGAGTQPDYYIYD